MYSRNHNPIQTERSIWWRGEMKQMNDLWYMGRLDWIMSRMKGSLIELGLNKKKRKRKNQEDWTKHMCLPVISHSQVPAESSGCHFMRMHRVIGCYFILNGGLWLVWHFTLNNRHWLVRALIPGFGWFPGGRGWMHTKPVWRRRMHTHGVKIKKKYI